MKQKLHEILQTNKDFGVSDEESINPTNQISIANALNFIRNPYKWCQHMRSLINQILKQISMQRKNFPDAKLYAGETWDLLERRWSKLDKDLLSKDGFFNISKLPDIYDTIKYDLLHNQPTMKSQVSEELYAYAKSMADIVIPQVCLFVTEVVLMGNCLIQRGIVKYRNAKMLLRSKRHYCHMFTLPNK